MACFWIFCLVYLTAFNSVEGAGNDCRAILPQDAMDPTTNIELFMLTYRASQNRINQVHIVPESTETFILMRDWEYFYQDRMPAGRTMAVMTFLGKLAVSAGVKEFLSPLQKNNSRLDIYHVKTISENQNNNLLVTVFDTFQAEDGFYKNFFLGETPKFTVEKFKNIEQVESTQYRWPVIILAPKDTMVYVNCDSAPTTPATPPPQSNYIVVNEQADYTTAAQRCADLGATLPMPKTQAENDALDASTSGDLDFFLGLSDAVTEGVWRWADGSSLAWANWARAGETPWGAEPNGGRGENYVLMLKAVVTHSHRWADVGTARRAGRVVCQAPAGVVTTRPVLTLTPAGPYVYKHTKVTMTCDYAGSVEFKIYKGETKPANIFFHTGHKTSTIANIEHWMSGSYSCAARRGDGVWSEVSEAKVLVVVDGPNR